MPHSVISLGGEGLASIVPMLAASRPPPAIAVPAVNPGYQRQSLATSAGGRFYRTVPAVDFALLIVANSGINRKRLLGLNTSDCA